MNLQVCITRLISHFGASAPLEGITAEQATEWAKKLRDDYAAATASRTIRRARQLFAVAAKRRLVGANPFAEIRAGVEVNRERQEYISADTVKVILDKCPSNDWRLIIALARYGGLRIPNELQGLTWKDIDWEHNWLCIRSPKKAGKEGYSRRVPIFPDIKPYLDLAFGDDAGDPVHVIAKHRNKSNLRTQFRRVIVAAGLTPWERLFHNLRSSCESDLATRYPAHCVSEWLGHSPSVAVKHYLQVPADAFGRAAKSGARALQNAVQQLGEPCAVLCGESEQMPMAQHSKAEGGTTRNKLQDYLAPREGRSSNSREKCAQERHPQSVALQGVATRIPAHVVVCSSPFRMRDGLGKSRAGWLPTAKVRYRSDTAETSCAASS